MSEYIDLFYTFAKMGAFTFGGGYAMLPLLEEEIVRKRAWATKEDLMDYYAVGQCTPGIIAVNVSTFIGYYRKGIPGAIVATLGIVFPSIVIIMSIASLIQNFSDLAIVQHALSGIRIAVCVLISNAVISLSKTGIKDKLGLFLFALAFVMIALFDVTPVILVLIAGSIGYLYYGKDRNV